MVDKVALEQDFFFSFFAFMLLSISLPSFHTYLSLPLMCAIALTRQQIITSSAFKLGGFISDLALGSLQSKEGIF
jgi:hypothetical protein